jgi:hypothetical protein
MFLQSAQMQKDDWWREMRSILILYSYQMKYSYPTKINKGILNII